MSRETAVQNAASLLSTFCGRRPDGTMAACAHDHSGDAEALVRSVEQFAFPELLIDLMGDAEHNPDVSLQEVLSDKADELNARAQVIEPR